MARELLIVRHAKSEWAESHQTDFERPIKKRGQKDAHQMGAFLRKEGLIPDYILSSTAKRAMETAKILAKSMDLSTKDISFDASLYLCEPHSMVQILENISSMAQRPMVVGHNPCLNYLVQYLSQEQIGPREDGKIMTTTAVAHFEMPNHWCPLAPHCGHLLHLWRPADLE